MHRPTVLVLTLAAAAVVLAGCSSMSATAPAAPKPVALQDGELPLPADYMRWPKFLSAVQRPDVKQVREIYVNPTGYNAKAGQPFSQGTTFVMENWAAQIDAAGNPVTGADGKLVKDKLLRVFVMSKGEGFGSAAIPELRNGDWAYAAYDAAGAKTADPLGACRACHLPLASKDFVHRYDEFFAARSKGAY
jgi:hemoglobin